MKDKLGTTKRRNTHRGNQAGNQRSLRTFFQSHDTFQVEEDAPVVIQDEVSACVEVVEDTEATGEIVNLIDNAVNTSIPTLVGATSEISEARIALNQVFEVEPPLKKPKDSHQVAISSLQPTSSSRTSSPLSTPAAFSPPPTDFTSTSSSGPSSADLETDNDPSEARPSAGTVATPIEISDSPPTLKKGQPLHPFFNRRVVRPVQEACRVIEISDSSPTPKKSQPLHPFFNGRLTQPKSSQKQCNNNVHTVQAERAPFPSRFTQHTMGPLTVLAVPTSPVLRPRKRRRLSNSSLPSLKKSFGLIVVTETVDQEENEAQIINTRSSFDDEDVERHIEDIPPDHLNHPAIQRLEKRLAEPDQPVDCSKTWSDKWKPRKAEEVLGNEQHARHLKSWLQSLNLSRHWSPDPVGTSAIKHTIVRSVNDSRRIKRRKTVGCGDDGIGGWLTDESGEDAPLGEDSSDFLLPYFSPIERRARAKELISKESETTAETQVWEELTNTLLISGPSGCGKTACVYACADQLGWQVFEVYPGISKRTGANLGSLVGNVARNHTLTKLPARGLDTLQELANPELAQRGHGLPPQSIILLEEVDILFGEDVNFWPAVIKLINKSHRPVVLTCNDPTVLPLEDLPIQAHLAFEPCPMTLAQSYLRCLALVEGHMLFRDDLQHLYKNQHVGLRIDYPDRPIHPLPTDAQPFYPDLRRAINRLQFWCASGDQRQFGRSNSAACIGDWATDALIWSRKGEDRVTRLGHLVDMHDLYQLGRFANCMSESDSVLFCRADPEIELEAMLHQEWLEERLHPDAETGYMMVGTAQDLSFTNGPVLGFYNKERQMRSCLGRRARARFEHVGSGNRLRKHLHTGGIRFRDILEERGLFTRRATYQRTVVHILDEILPPGGHGELLPRAVLFTEYLSWLRIMASVGDVDVDVDGSMMVVGRRRRRRSPLLSGEGVEILAVTELKS